MKSKEMKNETFDDSMHRLGRISMTFAVILLLAFPLEISLIFGEKMEFNSGYWAAFAALCVQYLPSDIIEVITYSPMLGTGATYIAFLTGNLINLKIPCVMNARALADTKINTPENDVVATISTAVSAIVTTITLAIGVLAIAPLTPLLENPVLEPAFKTVVSALMGALGFTYFSKYPKVAIIPIAVAVALFSIAPSLTSMVSIMVVVMAVISMAFAMLLYKKGKV